MVDVDKEKEDKYEFYLDESKKLHEWYSQLVFGLDKLVFALATGTIVLSINFIDKVTTASNITNLYLLEISWWALIVCLLASLASHIFAIKGTKISKTLLNKWLEKDKKTSPNLDNGSAKLASTLNSIAIFSLIVGIGSMAYFSSLNINSLTMGDDKNKGSTTKVEKFAESAPSANLTRADMNQEQAKPEKSEQEN